MYLHCFDNNRNQIPWNHHFESLQNLREKKIKIKKKISLTNIPSDIVGSVLGSVVGSWFGSSVGSLGFIVGLLLGSNDGSIFGSPVGFDGSRLGSLVGSIVETSYITCSV